MAWGGMGAAQRPAGATGSRWHRPHLPQLLTAGLGLSCRAAGRLRAEPHTLSPAFPCSPQRRQARQDQRAKPHGASQPCSPAAGSAGRPAQGWAALMCPHAAQQLQLLSISSPDTRTESHKHFGDAALWLLAWHTLGDQPLRRGRCWRWSCAPTCPAQGDQLPVTSEASLQCWITARTWLCLHGCVSPRQGHRAACPFFSERWAEFLHIYMKKYYYFSPPFPCLQTHSPKCSHWVPTQPDSEFLSPLAPRRTSWQGSCEQP